MRRSSHSADWALAAGLFACLLAMHSAFAAPKRTDFIVTSGNVVGVVWVNVWLMEKDHGRTSLGCARRPALAFTLEDGARRSRSPA